MAQAACVVALGLFATLATAAPAPRAPVLLPRQANGTAQVTFADIAPSPKLKWVSCYEAPFQCSYLTVPLDYANVTAGTTDVAFIRYFVSEDAEDLLFNPGGPGVSGTELLMGWGPEFAKSWGYNPVSFDPRGVSWTGPQVSCSYDSDNTTTLRRRSDLDALGDMTEIFNKQLQVNHACSVANEHTNAKYVGTSAVVQDMMHFTELQAAARGKDPKKALINFYGVSYGTLMGQTLVAMYPDRLGRVLLDANVYGVAHYQGWEPSGLDDLANGIWLFSKFCYEAGAKWCSLAAGAKSIDDVQARFDAAVEKLRLSPQRAPTGEMMDDTAFTNAVGQLLYTPRKKGEGYNMIANITLSVLNTNSTGVKMLKRDAPTTSPEMTAVITAVDIAGRYPWSKYEEWKAATEQLEATVPYGAKGLASLNGLWGLAVTIIPPPSQYFPGFKAITPNAKVLFVNTAGDPVTPRSGARQMSKLFAGSSVLVVNGPGHGYTSAPSKCADTIIATYFANGTVPAQETLCEPDNEASFYFGGAATA